MSSNGSLENYPTSQLTIISDALFNALFDANMYVTCTKLNDILRTILKLPILLLGFKDGSISYFAVPPSVRSFVSQQQPPNLLFKLNHGVLRIGFLRIGADGSGADFFAVATWVHYFWISSINRANGTLHLFSGFIKQGVLHQNLIFPAPLKSFFGNNGAAIAIEATTGFFQTQLRLSENGRGILLLLRITHITCSCLYTVGRIANAYRRSCVLW